MPSTIRQLRVFLCHASQDKSIVRELQQRLADEGWIDPWLDEKKLHPGEDWRASIEEAVESSDLVVICLSNNSVDKEGFVQKELRYAREIALEKPEGTLFLIPLRLEDCDVPRGLRFFQWADYFGEKKEQNYIELLDSFSIRRQQIVRREQEKALRAAEEKEKRKKEEQARRETEELAKREAEELARQRSLEIARKEEEERAHILALEKAKKETFEKTLEDAREKARLEAELYAQKEIKEKEHKGSLTNFVLSSFLFIVSLLIVGLVFGIGLVGLGQIGVGPFAKAATPTNLPPTATSSPTIAPNSPTPTPDNMLFFDNFDSGSTAKWVNNLTTSSIQKGEIYVNNGYLLAGSDTWRNYSIRANIKLISGEIDFGLVARLQDQNHFYLCQLWHNQIWLVIDGDNLAQGTFAWLAQNSYNYNFGESYKIRMDVQDKSISCYINNDLVVTAIDSTYPTGKFGIRVYNTEAAVDNVEVFELP